MLHQSPEPSSEHDLPACLPPQLTACVTLAWPALPTLQMQRGSEYILEKEGGEEALPDISAAVNVDPEAMANKLIKVHCTVGRLV